MIMAGGSGKRLWPLSRAMHPKQFLNLNGDHTMLQTTMNRLSDLDIASSITICNEEHRFFVAEQLREIDQIGSILLEPVGRNTAPAVALAAFTAKDDPLLLVLAADHVIQDEVAFSKAVTESIGLAESGKLVTFGIVPTEANTGYGYIKRCPDQDESGVGFAVEEFVEKPASDVAQSYLESGDYFWNSGMFLFRASVYLAELKKFRPDIYSACESSVKDIQTDLDFQRVEKSCFESCPSESIDYAVMENTSAAVVVPMEAGWSDIGSWSSLWDVSEKDDFGNVVVGEVELHKTENCYVRTDKQLVATIGVEDLVIVSTKDALMVSHKDSVHEAKVIVQRLKEKARTEWEFPREVYRPWGKYDSIDQGERYKVKRITVNPGAKLSVQMHHHRAEHWIVVTGTAEVTKGEDTFLLSENESTYVPVGTVHALKNPGKVPLELIEVQSGVYLGEDDIVRLSDLFGRA